MCQCRQCPIAMPIGASTTVTRVSTAQPATVAASSAWPGAAPLKPTGKTAANDSNTAIRPTRAHTAQLITDSTTPGRRNEVGDDTGMPGAYAGMRASPGSCRQRRVGVGGENVVVTHPVHEPGQ